MASQAETAGNNLQALVRERRALGGGLIWAAVMLLLLTLWFQVRETDWGILLWGLLALLAVTALGIGVAQFFRPAHPEATEEQARANLLKQRRFLASSLLAGSALLLLVGLWVASGLGLAAFGEVSALVLLAILGLGAGLFTLIPPEKRLTQDQLLTRMLAARRAITIGLLVAAGLALAVALWRFFGAGYPEGLPEGLGALALFVLFAGMGLWQALQPQEMATRQDMRMLVLITGGVTGLVIALVTIWRAGRSWGAIFSPEMPLSQSPGLWRLWLLAYIELFGLAILFGSLLLARADIRQSVAMRRLLYGYNAGLTGLLVLAILVLLNVVVYVTFPYVFEWTESRGLHALSPKSKNLLESLRTPTRAYVLLSPHSRLYKEVRPLLENAQAYSRLLQVEYVSPDMDANRYLKLVETYPAILQPQDQFFHGRQEVARGGILLVYGPEVGKKPPHAFIPVRDLSEAKFEGGKDKYLFKGEDVILSQLRMLANRETKPLVYFTQGNLELNLLDRSKQRDPRVLDRGGSALLVQRLKKDGYEVRGLIFGAQPKSSPVADLVSFTQKSPGDKHTIPDAKLIIIAHPLRPFAPEALAALEEFIEKKDGKLIVLTNSFLPGSLEPIQTNLEGLLRKYNVQLGKDFLIRNTSNLRDDPTAVGARPPADSRNKVAGEFRNRVFPLGGFVGHTVGLVRSVEPVQVPGGYEAKPLLQVEEIPNLEQTAFWAETDPAVLRDPFRYLQRLEDSGKLDARRSTKPISVAVTVSDKDRKPRLAVFGDACFASNFFVEDQVPYYDFLTSTIEWLEERPENIGAGPKESIAYNLDRNSVNIQRLVWLPLGLVLLGIAALGLGIWVVRRR